MEKKRDTGTLEGELSRSTRLKRPHGTPAPQFTPIAAEAANKLRSFQTLSFNHPTIGASGAFRKN